MHVLYDCGSPLVRPSFCFDKVNHSIGSVRRASRPSSCEEPEKGVDKWFVQVLNNTRT
jgi:hypothetical protein